MEQLYLRLCTLPPHQLSANLARQSATWHEMILHFTLPKLAKMLYPFVTVGTHELYIAQQKVKRKAFMIYTENSRILKHFPFLLLLYIHMIQHTLCKTSVLPSRVSRFSDFKNSITFQLFCVYFKCLIVFLCGLLHLTSKKVKF